MTRKISKEELKQPDFFVSLGDRVLDFFLEHLKLIIALVIAFLLGAAGWAGYETWNFRKEKNAQAAFFPVENELNKIREKLDEANSAVGKEKEDVKKSADKKETVKDPATLKAEFGDQLARYKSLMQEWPGTVASFNAAIDWAALCAEYKDYAGAVEALQLVAPHAQPQDFHYGLIYTQLGTMFSATGDNKKALEAYDKVIQAKSQAHLHADVLLRMGLVQEALGDLDKARSTYEKVSRDHSDSDAGQSAKSYLRLLTLKAANKG